MDALLNFANGPWGTALMVILLIVLLLLIWVKRTLENKRANSNTRRTFKRDKKK